jgi:hypothetical protein
MGIGIVLIFWGLVGLIGATVGSVTLPRVASHFTQGAGKDCRRLLLAMRLFPFACLAWASAVFVFYAVVNEIVFHRDPGIGDGWTCPLPNGYAIEMIDVTDRGFLYNPKTQDINLGLHESRDAISDVCELQLAGRYVLGGANCRAAVPHGPEDHDAILSYFLVDTGTGTHTDFPSYEALNRAATETNIQIQLDPIDVVYRRYRFTWFDAAAAAGMLGVPLFCAWLLFRWVMQIRNSGGMLPQPA